MLAIGAARYVFLVGRVAAAVDARAAAAARWRKVVAATQGIVLTVAAADVLPLALTQAALAVALAALAASFGQCVWWLWRRRRAAGPRRRAGASAVAGIAVALTVLALLLVWAALVAPTSRAVSHRGAFARLPLEARSSSRWPLSCPPPRAACWPGCRARCSACSRS